MRAQATSAQRFSGLRVALAIIPGGWPGRAQVRAVFADKGLGPARGLPSRDIPFYRMQYTSVLIVEDDPIASTVLAAWARQLGSTVTVVADIATADRALAGGNFDLILSDVNLPGNERLQWTEKLVGQETHPPVVLVTGNPALDTALRAANLPISGYLVKPLDFAQLQTLLQRVVTEHRHRTELRALSREAAWLLTTPAASEPGPLHDKLLHLARCLAAEAGRNPRETGQPRPDTLWIEAIGETITVLEKTKQSFRSRELGQLRQRLNHLLQRHAAPLSKSA